MAEKKLLAYVWTLLKRPGTHLLAVVVANTVAYVIADAGTSTMAILTYLLQMILTYRVWRGANLLPWLFLMLITIYEGFLVYDVINKGAGETHQLWTASHAVAVTVTVLALVSPGVRRRLLPLRGIKPAR